MASWDQVQTIGPPSLVPPKADFSALSEIVPAYYQGQQLQRQQAIQNAAKDLPDNPTLEDQLKVANRLFRLGDYSGASQLFTALNAQQAYKTPPSKPNPLGMNADAAPTYSGGAAPFVQPQAAPGQGAATAPVHDQNLRNDEQFSTAEVAAANQPRPVTPAVDPNAPLVPRPVQTVPGQVVRPGPTGPSPLVAPQAAPSPVAQGAPSPIDAMLPPQFRGNPMGYVNDQMTKGYTALDQAARLERGNVKGGDDLRAEAKQYFENAKMVQSALAPTPEARNALDPNVRRRALDIEEDKKTSDALVKMADTGVEARGHSAQLDEIDKAGQKVGYGIIPKLQSWLGEHGIETKGLSDIQAYERAIDYEAPQLRPIGSGRLMKQELDSFKSALGGLMTTPEGRRVSVQNLKLLSDYSQQIGAIAADTSLLPSERMAKIYRLPPPTLQTTAPIAGQAQSPQGGPKRAPPANPPAVTPRAIEELRANPQKRAEFDQYFGRGSAAKYLGNSVAPSGGP